MAKKVRADQHMVHLGLAPTREKAKRLIMEGAVYHEEKPIYKAGQMIDDSTILTLKKEALPFVSRGGLKLKKALDFFQLDISQAIALDIGASTGGFTDVMLQSGVRKVYAIDVGYGQLDWTLRQDPRVVVLERCNARYITKEDVPERADFFSMDVSFISTALILPAVKELLTSNASGVILIKPQFEAEREEVGKHGVIKDPALHEEIIKRVMEKWRDIGFYIKNLSFSPIQGAKGNREYLAYIVLDEQDKLTPALISKVVNEAFQELRD